MSGTSHQVRWLVPAVGISLLILGSCANDIAHPQPPGARPERLDSHVSPADPESGQ
jgi:hypothetical protein